MSLTFEKLEESPFSIRSHHMLSRSLSSVVSYNVLSSPRENTEPLYPVTVWGANYSSDIVDLYFSVQFRKRFLNQSVQPLLHLPCRLTD